MRLLKPPQDRREHRRIRAELPGHYMLANRREYPCTIVDVSVGGLALVGPKVGALGETVVINAGGLGRIMGDVVRHFNGGFAIELNMTGIAASRFADRLAEIEVRDAPNRRACFGRR